jgi:cytoskeletal protein CcmA (bactofilin family)
VRKAGLTKRLLVAGLGFLVLLWPAAATAADFRAGKDKEVIDGVVDNDVYAAGQSVTLTGGVTGDLIAGAQKVTVKGAVGGSLLATGQDVDVSGPVAHSVRLAGQNVTVDGSVGGDLLVTGQKIEIGKQAVVTRDVVVGGQEIIVDGQVGGNLKGGIQRLVINGSVKGKVDVQVQELVLGPAARIEGDLLYTSTKKAKISSGATIGGKTVRRIPARPVEAPAEGSRVVLGLIRGIVGPLLLGALLLWLTPALIPNLSGSIRRSPIGSLFAGIVGVIVIPVLIVVLLILAGIVGTGGSIPLILGVAFTAVLIVGRVVVGYAIGCLFFPSWHKGVVPGYGRRLLTLLVGVVLLAVVGIIPYAGGPTSALVAIVAIGGGVISLFRLRRASYEPAPAPH